MISLRFTGASDDKLIDIYRDVKKCVPDIVVLYRGDGYRHNMNIMNELYIKDYVEILSNDKTLLNHMSLWDENTKQHNIFKQTREGCWVRLNQLDNKNLRRVHNLTKMYYVGIFDQEDGQNEEE